MCALVAGALFGESRSLRQKQVAETAERRLLGLGPAVQAATQAASRTTTPAAAPLQLPIARVRDGTDGAPVDQGDQSTGEPDERDVVSLVPRYAGCGHALASKLENQFTKQQAVWNLLSPRSNRRWRTVSGTRQDHGARHGEQKKKDRGVDGTESTEVRPVAKAGPHLPDGLSQIQAVVLEKTRTSHFDQAIDIQLKQIALLKASLKPEQ